MASSTDFFQNQDRAKRHTFWLVVMFIAAVVIIIALTYLVVVVAWLYLGGGGGGGRTPGHRGGVTAAMLWQPRLLVPAALGVIAVVAGGALYKLAQLRGGGAKVAEMLGGRLVDTGTEDPDQRRLLNVVEEMAIASGTPVPPVYVMEDDAAINAFAAGHTPDDAVITVTHGTMRLLDREEMQGVIAHEFSHILHGDMRLNLRLIGVLHGILVIGLVGAAVLRGVFYGSLFGAGQRPRRREGEGDRGGGGAVLVIAAAAIALIVIGYVGVFFGRLIKAAVSRQREYLADASAVQFTRYPQGIGGALEKIGGYEFGSRLRAADAEQFSHMYFAQGVSNLLGGALSTHPPLGKRIRQILPGWDGQYPRVQPPEDTEEKIAQKAADLSRGPARREALGRLAAMAAATSGAGAGAESESESESAAGAGAGADVSPASSGAGHGSQGPDQPPSAGAPRSSESEAGGASPGSASAVGCIGQPTPEHLAYARQVVRGLPEAVRQAAREGYGARAVIYALLLDEQPKVAAAQLTHLSEHADAQVAALTRRLQPMVQGLEPESRLPLIDLCLGSLRRLSPAQHDTLRSNVRALAEADQRVDLFEWMLGRVLDRQLHRQSGAGARTRYYAIKPLAKEAGVLLSALAHGGQSGAGEGSEAGETSEDGEAARRAYRAGLGELGLDQPPAMCAPRQCGLKELSEALDRLTTLSIGEKKKLVRAAAACIGFDAKITVREGELMRVAAAMLGCPMPPLLPGQPLV